MSRYYTGRRASVWPWVLLVAWVAVIWGHSLMPGESSSEESRFVVDLVRKIAYGLYTTDNPFLARLIEEHPGVLRILQDSSLLSYYVRKGAHFSEYFVLGLLALNAVRRTFEHPLASIAVIGLLWAGIPGIDETIQRYVPGRAGMLSDVMIDMSGFGLALALCLPFVLLGALFGGRRTAEEW